jgi:predicted dinucleotide-binding enzyme
VSDADAVLLAIPGGAVADAFGTVTGWEGKTVIDATNLIGAAPPDGFGSNAEFVKSKTNGPTAKAFNLNFARLYDQLGSTRARPSNIWSGDEEARDTVETLIRDAGYDPAYAGGLDKASVQEQGIALIFALSEGVGPFFYRIAPPDEL